MTKQAKICFRDARGNGSAHLLNKKPYRVRIVTTMMMLMIHDDDDDDDEGCMKT
jgi:hypothetical protein